MNPVFLENEAVTESFGATLADIVENARLITLSGSLGAGKTTLVRGFMHALGYQGAVKSPTYTLVEPYEIKGRSIMHFDLYRLTDPEEMEYLGFRDYQDGATLCLIEWPENAKDYLPEPDLAITLKVVKDGRQISWQSFSDEGALMNQQLSKIFQS